MDIERGLCGPTALVAELLKAEFVGPHLHTLVGTRIVAHTNHYGAHLAQGGVTHDANFVARTRGVVFAIELGVGDCSLRLLDVAVLLEIRQDVKVNVQHIVFGPYDARTSIAVGVFSFGGNGEGNLVFVEIALVVRSQTYEEAGLTVLNRLLAHEAIGMGKHLQVLVATQVKADIFIDSTGIARRKIANGHCQCLLVVLQYLFLSRLQRTADTRRNHVVDGLLFVVLFEADSRNGNRSAHIGCLTRIKGLLVAAPLAIDKVKRSQTQDKGLLETRHKETHETDGGKVVDIALALFVFANRNAEEVPRGLLLITIASGDTGLALIHDIVAAHVHGIGSNSHPILEIFLVFVEGIILIDVLHVGRGLVGSAIRLGGVLSINGVAVGVVDILVTLQDAALGLIVVCTTEIVVAVC